MHNTNEIDETKSTTEAEPNNDESIEKFNMQLFMNRFTERYKPEYFSNYEGDHFITISDEGLFTTFKIGKKTCADFLIKCTWEFSFRGGRSREIATRIMDEFSGIVLRGNIKKKVSIRAGRDNQVIFIDLCNEKGQYIKIDKTGYSITEKVLIPFLRLSKHLPLPSPQNVNLKEFMQIWKKLFNFTDEGSAYLALSYAVKSLIPHSGANPILVIEGIQGSGKTTTSMILKKLIDPTDPPLVSPPKNEKDIFVMANSCYLIACDNLSSLSAEMSDVFCRVSTGGGISQRKLYTDDDEKVYDVMRPVLFNGIEQLTERPDFLERAIILHMKTLSPVERISEDAFWDDFQLIYPKLLGGLYSIISQVLGFLPVIRKNNLHRMTEFNRVGLAIDRALGMKDDYFSEILNAHNDEKLQNLFHNDLFLQAIALKLNESEKGYLIGTCGELMKLIFKSRFEKYPAYVIPKTPQQFRGRINRHKLVLEANGIEFGSFHKSSSRREFFIKYREVELPKDMEPDYLDILG